MDKQRATQRIRDTFNAPFDEGRFRNFAINLLNNVDEAKRFDYISGNYIRHSFKNHITKYKRLGTYTDPNGEKIDVLVVQLKNKWALERSRTMLRNFTSDYLKNRDEKDAALVAYYTTNPDDWRFSYIRMEYKRVQTDSGKFKIKEDITPAKRYSFLVGKNEPNHTAQAQLVDILADDRNNPTLTELENAFSVDAVTKQFYKDYRTQFEKLWNELKDIVAKDQKIAEEFETKTIDTANFAKKLMGQIVFLYFLQKKGWLGVGKDENGNFKEWGKGPKNFLHRLFKKEFINYGNFFNDVLEPLFYEALATERPNDVFTRFNCKIPFLNGGLFEPINDYNWEETDIRIDNDLIGEVFKTFDQYNFTVREDEPLEKEVAVDPEMLGKVFENLLPENLRKGKGAYYTPRTIVHYMCQESLINYLDTAVNKPPESFQEIGDDQLDVLGNIPIKHQLKLETEHRNKKLIPKEDIETLIREGDIILELETAIVEQGKKYDSVLMDSIKENAQALDDALANIKVCDPAIGSGAFPVGMLTEIVKARKVLEIYLGQKHGVYELKRHCIQNSLYGVDIDPGAIEIAKLRLWLSLVVDEDDYTTIQPLPNLDYKIMQGNSLIEEFHGISLDIEKKSEQKDLFAGGSDLDTFIDDLHQKQDDFFNAEHPREKKQKREAVETAIYNIFHNELEKKKSISALEAKEIETDLKEMTHGNKERNFFPWKLYFADVFREKGGFDVVIANPPYGLVKDKSLGAIYRKLYPETEFKIDLYSLFLLRAIQTYKPNGISIFIITNTLLDNYFECKVREKLLNETTILEINDLSDRIFEEAVVHSMIISFNNSKIKEYNIKTDISEEIIGDIFYIPSDFFRQQFRTTFYLRLFQYWPIIEKLNNHSTHLNSVIEISQTIKTGNDSIYISNSKQADNWMPILRGKDVKRYSYHFSGLFVDYGNHLANPIRPDIFLQPKLLIREAGSKIIATYDDEKYYVMSTLYNCTLLDSNFNLKYILSLINSKIFQFLMNLITFQKTKGAFTKAKIFHYWQLPVKIIDEILQKPFINLVNQILTAKKANPQADTSALEREIDLLVYKLYGLTEEEIQIVEESVNN